MAVLWCRRSADAATEALAALGLIPLLLDPAETSQFLEAMGEPSVLVIDCDALDDAAMDVLTQTRSAHPAAHPRRPPTGAARPSVPPRGWAPSSSSPTSPTPASTRRWA